MSGAAGDRASWPAIGTTAVVQVAVPTDLGVAVNLLRSELAAIDRIASDYRADSELSRLNAAAGRPVAVSSALHEAVRVALDAAAASDGLVDPTLGADPGWQEIRLLGWAIRLPAGARLDLGATAKALAADRAAARIAAALSGRGVLVSLGGDIAVAGAAPAGGWAIHVTDDHRSGIDTPGQRVWIRHGALATSGTTVRAARRLGGRAVNPDGPGPAGHHIIDPRTGTSATGPWRTVSVTAASCVDANTASTAAIILGAEAPAWLEARGLAARLVAHDGTVVGVGGWSAGPAMPARPGAGRSELARAALTSVSATAGAALPPVPAMAGAAR